MAPRRSTAGPKPRATKKKSQLPSPIPDLFTLAILEFRRRAPGRFPVNHLSWTSEHLHEFIEAAWENAGLDRQEYYWNASGHSFTVENQSQSAGNELAVNSTSPPKGRKAPTKSDRTKRTALPPPPDVQVRHATPPPQDYLNCPRSLSSNSTASSISIPLEAVVYPGSPRHLRSVVAPQPQRAHSALPPYPSSFPAVDSQRDEGVTWSGTGSPLPFSPPNYISRAPPFAFDSASSTSGHTGAALGIPGSVSGGGIPGPDPNIDPSLLDAQRQVRAQMCNYYSPIHPSLPYAHMSSAVGQWPWG